MNLSACEPSSSSPGVPTTPVPQKPAPSPRYNDITRPRALRVGGDGTQQTPQAGTTHSRLWDSSGENRQLIAGAPPNLKFFRCASIASLEHPSGAADFPSPWQGTIALPGSDEETVNTAQAWVAQILDNSGTGENGGLLFSDDGLANGRVLCQAANAIVPGAVEVIHKDESDTSNVGNMRSFLVACQKFGVPAGALFDVDDRDPKRIGLCLHVLSRVVRDTVPGFSGPFLSQLDSPSPCGSGGGHSASSTDDDDDASRESSTCCVDDDNNDEHPHRNLRPSSHSTLPSPPTTTFNNNNNNRSAASVDGGNPDKTGPPRSSGEQHHRGKKSFSAVGGEDEEERHRQATINTATTNTTTTTTTTGTASHARCAPPAHPAPSPFGQTLLWPLSPPPANGAFEAPPAASAAAAAAAAAQGSPEEHPAASPQRRPLSLPSRLSRTLPGGDNTLLSGVPLLSSPVANDTIWSNIFDDSQADDADGGDGARRIDARATWAPAAKKRSGFFSLEKGGRGERKGGQVVLDALTQPAAACEQTLSTWLSNLNLSSFAQDLANIGVEVMGDLRYVEEKDLSEIGMHGPQIRKLLQNRP